ncbi:hypothetical protein [Jannaschia seohaensis]|uniref:Uncharacterized protein n=1 Tax=Jannaschia seohaensis TaxID=475081 RepID=A0A2Y9AY50_9RHOB|nr:hypothetical protein [Jannaschia seohaensis]PWJ17414.1 hypothetical protein BCF38_10624 [Jannaschia seohaensis]SSA47477.1 hypothetical protein SAMN05421539_10624 [Jannaschia seohaensis]
MTHAWASVLALCMALLALPAGAQDTPVRSGEHANFTRLVFPAQTGARWTESRAGNRVTLDFGNPEREFDTSTVFDRIPRSRLADIETGGGRLKLDLACDCDVNVFQIHSGHVVVDITAADTDATRPPSAETEAEVVSLPLRLASLPTFRLEPHETSGQVAAAAPQAKVSEPAVSALPVGSAQISIRTLGRRPLLPSEVPNAPVEIARTACAEEDRATIFLQSDRQAALGDLPNLHAGLVDDVGVPIPSAYAALANAYLTLGWGAEAGQVLRMGPQTPDAALLTIADALDGLPGLDGEAAALDATCGPATAVLALLAGVADADWRNVDETAFARFVDRLPRATRDDLLPRLRPALRRLGREDLLFLDPPPRDPPTAHLPVAAGTDLAAIDATLAALSDGAVPATPEALANGLALRRSVPSGPLRDDLDGALARALVRAGHLTEAEEVVGTRADLAEETLDFALRELPAEEAVLVAMRLRPALPPGGPAARRAGAALQAFGLTPLLRSFGAPAPPPGPVPAAFGSPEERAWIERDFTALDPDSRRGQLADLRQRRNASSADLDDFSRATAAIESSAELSAVLQRLIDAPD